MLCVSMCVESERDGACVFAPPCKSWQPKGLAGRRIPPWHHTVLVNLFYSNLCTTENWYFVTQSHCLDYPIRWASNGLSLCVEWSLKSRYLLKRIFIHAIPCDFHEYFIKNNTIKIKIFYNINQQNENQYTHGTHNKHRYFHIIHPRQVDIKITNRFVYDKSAEKNEKDWNWKCCIYRKNQVISLWVQYQLLARLHEYIETFWRIVHSFTSFDHFPRSFHAHARILTSSISDMSTSIPTPIARLGEHYLSEIYVYSNFYLYIELFFNSWSDLLQ